MRIKSNAYEVILFSITKVSEHLSGPISGGCGTFLLGAHGIASKPCVPGELGEPDGFEGYKDPHPQENIHWHAPSGVILNYGIFGLKIEINF